MVVPGFFWKLLGKPGCSDVWLCLEAAENQRFKNPQIMSCKCFILILLNKFENSWNVEKLDSNPCHWGLFFIMAWYIYGTNTSVYSLQFHETLCNLIYSIRLFLFPFLILTNSTPPPYHPITFWSFQGIICNEFYYFSLYSSFSKFSFFLLNKVYRLAKKYNCWPLFMIIQNGWHYFYKHSRPLLSLQKFWCWI